jgi:bacterioferritin-associated ferredoxin
VFACICEAVTEDEVELAVLGGAQDREAVTDVTGAGSCCGTCHARIELIVERLCPVSGGAVIDLGCPLRDDAQLSA